MIHEWSSERKIPMPNGLVVEIVDDEGGGDPRDDDNLGLMFCWHPDYSLGDEQFRSADGRGSTRQEGSWAFESMEAAKAYLKKNRRATHIIPLYLYDHSGLAIRAGSPAGFPDVEWDVTMVGYICTTPERLAGMGTPEERVDAVLHEEVEEYSRYLSGEVYGYRLVDPVDDYELESLWGLLGLKYAEEAGREHASLYEPETVARMREARRAA